MKKIEKILRTVKDDAKDSYAREIASLAQRFDELLGEDEPTETEEDSSNKDAKNYKFADAQCHVEIIVLSNGKRVKRVVCTKTISWEQSEN